MRRAVTALAAVIGLVLSGVAAHLVFRPAPRPPLAAPQTYSAPLTPEPYPDEPADFIVRRSQTWSGWELSAAASPDRLGPVPEHDPADQSLIGSTSCGEAHTALRTVDEDGVPLITEPVPPLRPKDVFDEVFEWCHAPARTFRPAGSCQSV